MMIYSYDKLWKLLIDRKITKTEMRQQTGISTNMLAKMGKQMPVSMEALAKICNYLGCGLDDVVEIALSAAKYSRKTRGRSTFSPHCLSCSAPFVCSRWAYCHPTPPFI